MTRALPRAAGAATFALALALVSAITMPAASSAQDNAPTTAALGQLAPDIQASEWIGGDGRTSVADFRGEVVLLQFWGTHCGPSRGQVRYLTKLTEDFGKRGLTVVGITGDARDVVLRYMTHNDANFGYAVAIGGAPGYPVPGTPYAALIGPDGKVAYLGNPGSLSSKVIEDLLRKVQKPTPEQAQARAAKMLESAETLIADGQLVRAEVILAKVVARHATTEAGKQAALRAKELAAGEMKAEYDAQKDLAKLVGGVERPAEADSKKAQKLAKALEKRAAEWKATAPRAAALAAEWAVIFASPWK